MENSARVINTNEFYETRLQLVLQILHERIKICLSNDKLYCMAIDVEPFFFRQIT